ncbi:10112_t:CDS:2, partial [Dentiscutata erythropus]
NLEKSTNRIKADRATILLEQSDKKYNLYTTFELNQVIYHKTFNVLSAKNGSGETMKSSATDLNTKREKVETYEQMANPKNFSRMNFCKCCALPRLSICWQNPNLLFEF